MSRFHPLLIVLVVSLCLVLVPKAPAAEVRHEIHFPNVLGYRTITCDLHVHTVFSDGNVWPPVRVAEAWRQGLHAIAITDHIEYQPHKDDVPTQHNRSYELAEEAAKAQGLMLLRGAEITRDTPPGHFNAVFLKDVKPLETEDLLEVVKRATQQGAFVFWNHHAWKGAEKGRWLDIHTTMYENKWLHGMEVANGDDYYPEAHRWCLEKNLTMVGNSDIHDPDLRLQSAPNDHRTMTLVFAKDRSLPALKEALQQGRTAVWCKERLIGKEEFLHPLFEASIDLARPHLRTKDGVFLEVRNCCDADVRLRRVGRLGPAEITLPARTSILLKIGVSDSSKPLELTYTATNFLTGPNAGMSVTLRIPGP
jgi:hypothetical protein